MFYDNKKIKNWIDFSKDYKIMNESIVKILFSLTKAFNIIGKLLKKYTNNVYWRKSTMGLSKYAI